MATIGVAAGTTSAGTPAYGVNLGKPRLVVAPTAENSRVRHRVNRETGLLICFLVLMENIFYLVDTDAVNVAGVFNYDLIWQALFVVYMGWLFVKGLRKQKVESLPMGWAFALLAVTVVVAAAQCNLLTGQPFARGFIPQRGYLLALVSAFFLYPAVMDRRISINDVQRWVMYLGCFATCLYIVQSALGSSATFIHVNMNERYDSSRLYVDSCLCIMSGLIGFYRLCKTQRVCYLAPVFLLFCYELFVSKGRLEMVSVVCALLVILMLVRGMDTRVIAAAVVVVAASLFLASDYGQEILSNYVITDENDTMTIRQDGREYYWNQQSQSISTILLGCGYPSTLYAPAAARAGIYLNYYLVDNGIFAFVYVYGFLGLAGSVAIWGWMLVRSVRLARMTGNSLYLAFVILNLVLSYNIVWWWWSGVWPVMMVLMFCFLRRELLDAKELRDEPAGTQGVMMVGELR